jgi:anti-anti-sigma factor
MVDTQHLTRAQRRLAVLTFPAEIDICNARQLGGELGSALASAAMVIADLTATTFCDCSGIRALVLAQAQAAATGIELRLVVPSAGVRRAFALTGADRLLPVCPSLQDALGSQPCAGSVSYLPGQDLAGALQREPAG